MKDGLARVLYEEWKNIPKYKNALFNNVFIFKIKNFSIFSEIASKVPQLLCSCSVLLSGNYPGCLALRTET